MVATLKGALAEAAAGYWSGQVWVVSEQTSKLDQEVYDGAWEEGRAHPDEPRLRIVDRVRSRLAWFAELADPPWEARAVAEQKGPPIVVFTPSRVGSGWYDGTSFVRHPAGPGSRASGGD